MQTDFSDSAFKAILGGQAVVKTLVRQLHRADEEAVLGGEDAVTQLNLQKYATKILAKKMQI